MLRGVCHWGPIEGNAWGQPNRDHGLCLRVERRDDPDCITVRVIWCLTFVQGEVSLFAAAVFIRSSIVASALTKKAFEPSVVLVMLPHTTSKDNDTSNDDTKQGHHNGAW